MSRRRGRRRVAFLTAAAGAAAVAVALAANYRSIVSSAVTYLAFRDGERLGKELSASKSEEEFGRTSDHALKWLTKKYSKWFRNEFFDREAFLRRCPATPTLDGMCAPGLIIAAYLGSKYEHIGSSSALEEIAIKEAAEWLNLVFRYQAPKELLVNFLTRDLDPFGKAQDEGGLAKRGVFTWLFSEGRKNPLIDFDSWAPNADIQLRTGIVLALPPESWDALLRDCGHPREKVRAGSLLILHHHPDPEVILDRSRRALADPSEWVRLAGAGLLALRGDAAGEAVLVAGLDHERWEIRFWSVYGLHALGKPSYLDRYRRRHAVEADPWFKEVLKEAMKADAKSPTR